MFKVKFSEMYDNTIFTKYGLTPVAEDYYKIEKNTFCVADGVTRDDVNGNAVAYPKTQEEAEEWIKNYPNPSGAYEAAKIVCESFVKNINAIDDKEISQEAIERSIKKSNELLIAINKNRKIDYVKEDLYCCEAVGGKIIGNKLYCFSIGDCHITILNDNFDVIFNSINNHKRFEDFLNNIYIKENEFDWEEPKFRKIVRKEYRNNPSKKYKGKDVSFGALSGEKQAEYYIDTYCVDLEDAKYICAYSDGCEPFFKTKETTQILLKDLEILKKDGNERTLIVYEKV